MGSPAGRVRISFIIRSATPTVSLSIPNMKSNGINVALRGPPHWRHIPRQLNPLFTPARFVGSMDSMPMRPTCRRMPQ
jgi:hypothetical protein